jgi:hypothetical protein
VDAAITDASADARAWLVVGCLACIVGAVHGWAWQLAFSSIRPLRRWLQWLIWPAAMLCVAVALADELGVFKRLGSRHHELALKTLLVIGPCAAAAGALLGLLQPMRDRPIGGLSGTSRWLRAAAIAVLSAICVAAFYVDHRYYVGLYPAAHSALRHVSLVSATLSLGLAWELMRGPRISHTWAALAVALLLVAVVAVEVVSPRTPIALSRAAWAGEVIRRSQPVADGDRDGYSALLGGGDCDDWNAAVHPGAPEIAENGLDDNCVLGDRRLKPERVDVIATAKHKAPNDVVLITIDTLRPDHLGVYNRKYRRKSRQTSPNLDRWSREAHVFRNAFTTGAWTVLALSSVMRGVYPRRIEWTPYYETTGYRLIPESEAGKLKAGESLMQLFLMPPKDSHLSLATLLGRRGMQTVAVVDDGYSSMFQSHAGIDAGFDEYVHMRASSLPDDQATINRALMVHRRLGTGGQRFFLWVHLFGPHSPNEVRPDTPAFGSSLVDGYDHEVRFMDQQLGRLLDAVESRRPKPIVIVAGDHGEYFSPTNRWHGYSLEEDTMRIPLLIKLPESRKRSMIDATVSIVDLFPTILALTDTPGPQNIDGVDLTPLLEGAASRPRIVLTDCWRYLGDRRRVMDSVGATDGKAFVFYDRLTGAAYRTETKQRGGYFLGNPPPLHDQLVRVALGYLEEVPDLPQ